MSPLSLHYSNIARLKWFMKISEFRQNAFRSLLAAAAAAVVVYLYAQATAESVYSHRFILRLRTEPAVAMRWRRRRRRQTSCSSSNSICAPTQVLLPHSCLYLFESERRIQQKMHTIGHRKPPSRRRWVLYRPMIGDTFRRVAHVCGSKTWKVKERQRQYEVRRRIKRRMQWKKRK